MRKTIVLLTALWVSAPAHQVFFMDMEETLGMTSAVVMAEVTYTIRFPMDLCDRLEYGMKVLEVLSGDDSLESGFMAHYEMLYPISWIDEEGNEVLESPIVSGSGFELEVHEGDTVLAFLGYLSPDTAVGAEILRLEPLDSLERVSALLDSLDL